MNLHFRTASKQDALDADDPLTGHTAHIEGTAQKDDVSVSFVALLDVAPDTEMVGGPFDAEVTSESTEILTLRVHTVDPVENDTLFDGLAFDALDDDDDGNVEISPGAAAHNILMKTVIRHDHYDVTFSAKP
jgi:hypothetical protein